MDGAARVAENESLFRSANERIEATAIDWGAGESTVAFMCECSDLDCLQRVEVSLSVYETVRAQPERFLVLPGHQWQAATTLSRRPWRGPRGEARTGVAYGSAHRGSGILQPELNPRPVSAAVANRVSARRGRGTGL